MFFLIQIVLKADKIFRTIKFLRLNASTITLTYTVRRWIILNRWNRYPFALALTVPKSNISWRSRSGLLTLYNWNVDRLYLSCLDLINN